MLAMTAAALTVVTFNDREYSHLINVHWALGAVNLLLQGHNKAIAEGGKSTGGTGGT